MGADSRVVEKAGAWYSFEGDRIGQGRDNVRQFLKENPDVADRIENQVRVARGLIPAEPDPAPAEVAEAEA